jgi:hypothetical protein
MIIQPAGQARYIAVDAGGHREVPVPAVIARGFIQNRMRENVL